MDETQITAEEVEEAKAEQAGVLEVVSKTSSDDKTRQEIARRFVNYYFSILILIIVGVPIYNYLM